MKSEFCPDGRELITLDNGARIVLDPMIGLKTVAINVAIGTGARHEREHLNGLAHFLEHMVFKGANGMDALELVEKVEDLGGVINASTCYERTQFTIRCLSEDAPQMLEHLLYLAVRPDLPANEISRERQVVLQEIGEAHDEPADHVFDLVHMAAWPGHPLGRLILGQPETLAQITRDDFVAFRQAGYTSRNLVVSLSGHFEREDVLAPIFQLLSDLPEGDYLEESTPTMSQGYLLDSRETEQSVLVMAMAGPSHRAEERFAARLLTEIMGGGMSSRLYQEVREKRGLAYAIDVYLDAYKDVGRFDIYCGCAPDDAQEVEKVVSDLWGEMATRGPNSEELNRAKAITRASTAMSLESLSGRAATSGYELLTLGRLVSSEWALEQVSALSTEDVRQAAELALSGPLCAAGIGVPTIETALSAFTKQ